MMAFPKSWAGWTLLFVVALTLIALAVVYIQGGIPHAFE